jgi:hypothetical protein
MVCVSVFESSIKDQTLRTLIALTILITGDVCYLYGTNNLQKLTKNKMAFINTWLVVAIVLGVSNLIDTNKSGTYPSDKEEYAYYGILVALLVYVPLNSWLSSQRFPTKGKHKVGISNMDSFFHIAFSVAITSLAAMFTFMIAQNSDLIDTK